MKKTSRKPKKKFGSKMAAAIATRLSAALSPHCSKIAVAGSLRRNAKTVGDIDLVVCPIIEQKEVSSDLFTGVRTVDHWRGLDVLNDGVNRGLYDIMPAATTRLAERTDFKLIRVGMVGSGKDGAVAQPKNFENSIVRLELTTRVEKTKHYKQKPLPWDGMRVDIYLCSAQRYALNLFIRTGPKENNILFAKHFQSIGMELKADGTGIVKDGNLTRVYSERQVYELAGLEYEEPWER